MKTLLHCCALALGLAAAAAPARAQSTDWLWTTSMGWPGQFGPSQNVIGTRLAATADGGALVSVTFVGSVNFGGRRDTLVSLGNADAAVVKYSAAGAKLWTARIGGLEGDEISGMGTDAQGNVYVTGTHRGLVYFFTQAGDFLPGAGAFLAKYTAAGVFVQAVSVGQGRPGFVGVNPSRLLVAPSGACTIVGGFSGAVTVGSFSLVSVGNYTNAFVAQVAANGTVTSARQFSADGLGPELRSLAALPNGDVLVGGKYEISITFAATTTLTASGYSYYAVCYTPAGAVRWARNLPLETSVAAGPGGQAYAVGNYRNALALDTLRATSSGGLDVFVARLDALSGAAQGLAYAGGGPGDQVPLDRGLAFGATGLPTLTLRNDGPARFGAVALPVPTPQFHQFAALQLSAAWQPQRAFTTESRLYPLIEPAVALDPANNVFMLVNARSLQSFGALGVQPQGSQEVVLARTGLVLAARPASAGAAGVQVYPNPARTTATVVAPAGLRLVAAVLLDALGRTCWAGPLPTPPGRAEVPVAGLAPGLYTLRLRTADGRWLASRLAVQP